MPKKNESEKAVDTDAYPVMHVDEEMVAGGDWQEYRPSLRFRAKVMMEPGSVETKAGIATFEPGDVVAALPDHDLHVFSESVFASEYEPAT